MAQLSTKELTPNTTPFRVHIPDDGLLQLDTLLRMTPIAQPTHETSLPGGDRKFGMRQDWLKQAVGEWQNAFGWRKHEAYMNTFDHFHMNIEDDLGNFNIHFVAMYSKRQDAVPLLLLHGWPGSFLEFLPMIDKLRNKYSPDDLPYHVVVPSLPGYAFSNPPPLDKDFGIEDVARLMNQLMLNLGYEPGYMVQGGDVGSKVARVMAVKHEECKGKHPQPFGYSYYPHELYLVPKSWAATTGNLTFFRAHKNGGHFAAIEQTETFLKDLEEFVQESRRAAGLILPK
ncbi:epoxide hydrolase 1, partial [Aureobasidium melanogenum]